MTSLKEEEPFAFVVKTKFLQNTCSSCLAFQGAVDKCRGCHVLSYCNEQCQKNDWANHKNECRILEKEMMSSKCVPDNHVRLAIRVLLKSEKDLSKKAFNGRTWEALEEHVKVEDENAADFYSTVDNIVALMKSVKEVSREEVVKTLNKIITNDVAIEESVVGIAVVAYGIFLGLSIHKHSCVPDSQLIFTGTKASLRAFDETAEYSTDLTIIYTNFFPFILNEIDIFKMKYFDCTCPLCADANHILNRMGSSCYVSCCKDAAGILDENSSGPYRCNKCGAVSPITIHNVAYAVEKIKSFSMIAGTLLPADLNTNLMINKKMDLHFACEKVLSVYNFRFLVLLFCFVPEINFQGLHSYAQEKLLKGFEWYLPAGDKRKIAFLLYRMFLKNTNKDTDTFDDSQVLGALERTFGTDHPVTVKFKDPISWKEHFMKTYKEL